MVLADDRICFTSTIVMSKTNFVLLFVFNAFNFIWISHWIKKLPNSILGLHRYSFNYSNFTSNAEWKDVYVIWERFKFQGFKVIAFFSRLHIAVWFYILKFKISILYRKFGFSLLLGFLGILKSTNMIHIFTFRSLHMTHKLWFISYDSYESYTDLCYSNPNWLSSTFKSVRTSYYDDNMHIMHMLMYYIICSSVCMCACVHPKIVSKF